MNYPTKNSQSISLFFLILYFSSFTFGQTNESTLIVTVQDQLGNIILNSRVILLDSNNKEIRKETDKLGQVRFSKLSSDEYKIVITSTGFLEYKSETIVLKTGEIKKLEIVLELAPVESEVEVTNEDSVQADDYGLVTIITQEEIQKLPDDPEEFLRALRRLVGESITGDDLPIEVNGFREEQIPPKQMIEQIRVDRNIFSAKYAGAGGGGIQIFTSSRVEKFKGFVNFGFADSRLNAGDPFLGRRVPYQSRNYRFGLSGPLGKKTSFSLSASRNERDSNSVINAVILDSNLQPIEYKETFPTPSRNHILGIIVNSDPFKKHKIYLSYNLGLNQGSGQGVGLFTLPERANRNKQQSHSLAFSHTYLGNENFLNRFRFTARRSQSSVFAESDRPAINVAESFSSGGSPSNSSSKSQYFSLSNDTSWQWRKISFEYGFGLSRIGINQNSRSNFNGTYNFNGRLAPILDTNNNPLVDDNGNIITEQISSLESYRRTLLFRRLGYSATQIRELGGGADQFSISGGNPEISASQVEYNLYLQGSYTIKKNLGISFGLRYENQNNIKSPLNLAPRFSLIWSPKKKEKENVLWSLPRISAGIGLNYSRFDVGNTISVRRTNDEGRAYYLLSATNAVDANLSTVILDFFPNAPAIPLLERLSLPRSRRFFEKGIQTPYDLTSNITFNKKLPAQFAAVFSVTQTQGFRRQISTNINAPIAGTFDPLNPLNAMYPFDNLGNIYQISSRGRAKQTLFSIDLRFPQIKFLKKPISLNLRYSLMKSRDDIVFGSGSPFDAYDFSQEFAPNSDDGLQVLKGNFSQDLPFKFTIGGNWAIRNGTRFNITTGRDSNGDGIYNERPAFALNPNKSGVINTSYGLLDPNPSFGDKIIPRNLGRGPGNLSFDMYLMKSFGFGRDEKNKKTPNQILSFSVFASNVFNITNKGNPIGNMASPRFVRIISNGGVDLTDDLTRSTPRSINFSLNFYF